MAAVRAVKRSGFYREARSGLLDVAPAEAWTDAEEHVHIVLFALHATAEADEFLAFNVAVGRLSVQNPLILSVQATTAGWRATTRANRAVIEEEKEEHTHAP